MDDDCIAGKAVEANKSSPGSSLRLCLVMFNLEGIHVLTEAVPHVRSCSLSPFGDAQSYAARRALIALSFGPSSRRRSIRS